MDLDDEELIEDNKIKEFKMEYKENDYTWYLEDKEEIYALTNYEAMIANKINELVQAVNEIKEKIDG